RSIFGPIPSADDVKLDYGKRRIEAIAPISPSGIYDWIDLGTNGRRIGKFAKLLCLFSQHLVLAQLSAPMMPACGGGRRYLRRAGSAQFSIDRPRTALPRAQAGRTKCGCGSSRELR